jgi:predicted nucleic acid-binding protein
MSKRNFVAACEAHQRVAEMLKAIQERRASTASVVMRMLIYEAAERTNDKRMRFDRAYTGGVSIHVDLSREERDRFREIQKRWGLSASDTLRHLIVEEYERMA